ncbi:MAG: ABC transporter ATP-binding protein [Bacteroidales bacterium]|jgi:NitT/TauT family transport system ATP-binding protein
METMSLRLENISKSYGDRPVLDQFTLAFKSGSITCLFGPSGCGKTAILNLIGGISTPDAGIVSGFGEQKISCIFQENRLLPWKTVLGNVLFPLLDKFPIDQAMDSARKFIKLVGLEKEEAYYPRQLSGGMKQRVSIARAFAFPGNLILMDEAFQSLDNTLKYNILDSFLEIWKEDLRTVIFVTHDIDEAIKLGQEIIFMNHRPLQVIRSVNTSRESAMSIKVQAGEIYHQ